MQHNYAAHLVSNAAYTAYSLLSSASYTVVPVWYPVYLRDLSCCHAGIFEATGDLSSFPSMILGPASSHGFFVWQLLVPTCYFNPLVLVHSCPVHSAIYRWRWLKYCTGLTDRVSVVAAAAGEEDEGGAADAL